LFVIFELLLAKPVRDCNHDALIAHTKLLLLIQNDCSIFIPLNHEVGISSIKLLFDRVRVTTLFNDDHDGGRIPLSCDEDISNICILVKADHDDGSVAPTRGLAYSLSSISPVRILHSDGSVPVSPFAPRFSLCSDFIPVHEDGNDPFNILDDISRFFNPVQVPHAVGKGQAI
jgi:hypothetical protein